MNSTHLGIEAASLLFAGFLVWLSVIVQHFANISARGAGYVMSDRSVAPAMQGFFGRSTRTLSNNIESATMYAPAVILLVLLQHTSSATGLAAAVYIGARGIFSIAYWLNIPMVRSLAWFTGMICSATMMAEVVLAQMVR
jgi:uncharacterized MAPEG superfamily protein